MKQYPTYTWQVPRSLWARIDEIAEWIDEGRPKALRLIVKHGAAHLLQLKERAGSTLVPLEILLAMTGGGPDDDDDDDDEPEAPTVADDDDD